jgi:hypothetical protein
MYYFIHGYCTQCSITEKENFTKPLTNMTCKWFDTNFCSKNCYAGIKDALCVYYNIFPMCYVYGLNIFLRSYDGLHIFIIQIYAFWSVLIILIFFLLVFPITIIFILIPGLIKDCFMPFQYKPFKNRVLDYFTLDKLTRIILFFMQFLLIFGGILDLILRSLNFTFILFYIIQYLLVFFELFTLIIMWSQIISKSKNILLENLSCNRKFIYYEGIFYEINK